MRNRHRKRVLVNTYCPTGEGGGVDPSCSPGGGSGKQTDTPAFKKWFGNSKAVDGYGNPLKVFHGATQDFDEFRDNAFFTDRPEVAGDFASSRQMYAGEEGAAARTVVAYVRIEKPFVIDAGGKPAGEIQFARNDMYGYRKGLESKKHDGVIIKNTSDEGTLYIPKKSHQIKSAIGNRGTFDLSNLLITHSLTANAIRKSKRRVNPLRVDPTRTAGLRRALIADLRRRFARIKLAIHDLLVKDDALGLKERAGVFNSFCPTGEGGGIDPSCSPSGKPGDALRDIYAKGPAGKSHTDADIDKAMDDLKAMKLPELKEYVKSIFGPTTVFATFGKSKIIEETARRLKERLRSYEQTRFDFGSPTTNAPGQWRANSDPEKLKLFQAWLREQFGKHLSDADLWKRYAEVSFKKGAGRSFDDVKMSKLRQSRPELFTPEAQGSLKDFYNGTKEEFLRSAFARPVPREKIELLASRSFDDLENVTSDMSARMSRHLADGMAQGKGPREIARDLDGDLGIGRNRATLIARTEIIRAHASGQLQALEDLGVEEVGVMIEWSVSDPTLPEKEGGPCELCLPMNGAVFKIAEAQGMIPRHPNCKCSWTPANVGEDKDNQQRGKRAVESAIKASQDGDDDWGPATAIAKERPVSVLNAAALDVMDGYLTNVFCATGEGGGVDPSCSPGGGIPGGSKSDDRGNEFRDATQEGDFTEVHYLGVNRVVSSVKEDWKYQGSVKVVNEVGPKFERGGVQWQEGGNCILQSGEVTIRSPGVHTFEAIRHITGHELMHGTFEKVHQQYVKEREDIASTDIDAIRASGELKEEFRDKYPTYARMYPLLESTGFGDNVYQKLMTDDGITDYSKAYWRDFSEGKCTYHIAVHETLAEIAGIHEASGKILGSKTYRDLYKATRDEYKVVTGSKKSRSGTKRVRNEKYISAFADHEMYLDASFSPTTIEKAVWLRWWKSDGSNGYSVRATDV